MALFRRNKNANLSAVPEEVDNYYQAEKRDRTWMAWLLALLSLAVTTLIIMALFFGGRWVYRKIRPSTPSSPIAGNQTNESPAQNPSPQGGSNNSATNTQAEQEKAKEEQRKKEEEEKRKEQEKARVNAPANPTPNPTPGTATGPATTATPSTNSNLPETGPGDVIAIFVLTTAAGALVHRYVLRQTSN